MGIKYLFSFVEDVVQNGRKFKINMRNEVELYKREHGEIPLIIFDLNYLKRNILFDKPKKLLGGCYKEYNDLLITKLKKLKTLNAKIVFCMKTIHQVHPKGIEKKLHDNNSYYNSHIRILNQIDAGIELNNIKGMGSINTLMPFFDNMGEIACKYGELYVTSLNNHNQEMAFLANEMNAIAVISYDSDMLIYKGSWRLWSAANINYRNLNTIEFNKNALKRHLSLESHEMPLFGTLCGNSRFLPGKHLVKYFQMLNSNKFERIAKNIKTLEIQSLINDDDFLADNIFGTDTDECQEELEQFKHSIRMYSLENMNHVYPDEVTKAISHNWQKRLILSVLLEQKLLIKLQFIDLSYNNLTPYYELVQSIYRRFFGIILKHKQNECVTQTVYCKLSHETPYEERVIEPDYPNDNLPSLLTLLTFPYREDSDLDELRWKLLCWQISSKLNNEVLSKLPREQILTVVTVFFLYEKKQINLDEADCLLLSCNYCIDENIQQSLKLSDFEKIDGRDARLAFLFTSLLSLIKSCFAAVGLDDFSNLITFDGLYFHALRKIFNKDINGYKKNLLLKFENLRIYSPKFGLLE